MQVKSKSVHFFIVMIAITSLIHALSDFVGSVAPNGIF